MADELVEDDEHIFFFQKRITSPATGEYPSMEEFPGIYNFEFDVGQQNVEGRRESWQYSSILKKIYTKEGRSLPLKFKITGDDSMPSHFYVRTVAAYMDADSATLPVLRCVHHLHAKDDMLNKNNHHRDHVVSSCHCSAVFEVDEKTERRSVCVPLTGPQPGSEWQTIMFSMMCRSSCNSGINRRPISLIFTLEHQYQVYGRRVIQIRVCASPHRDRAIDENRLMKKDIEFSNSGSINGKYYVPVLHHDDYITLIKEARDLVLNDLPDGPEKTNELIKFEQILMHTISGRPFNVIEKFAYIQ